MYMYMYIVMACITLGVMKNFSGALRVNQSQKQDLCTATTAAMNCIHLTYVITLCLKSKMKIYATMETQHPCKDKHCNCPKKKIVFSKVVLDICFYLSFILLQSSFIENMKLPRYFDLCTHRGVNKFGLYALKTL